MDVLRRLMVVFVSLFVILGAAVPSPAEAATSSQIVEAQRILTKFAIPTGPIDGVWGAQTAQGMCTFRQLAGLSTTRGGITSSDLSTLRNYNSWYSGLGSIPAPARNGRSTYLLANETCQTMVYVRGGAYVKVLRISTGRAGYPTPNGNYWLGATYPGWSCSTAFPEGCYYHSAGANAWYTTKYVKYSKYGNMYNKRSFSGAYMLHGSGSVPTYPASHGCIRVSVANSDWLYRNISNSSGSLYFSVIGQY